MSASVNTEVSPKYSEPSRWRSLWLPALVCLLLLLIEGWLVFHDSGFETESNPVASRGPAVAQVKEMQGEVRSKAQGTIAWEPPSVGAPLHDSDSLATMPEASALLAFGDGSELLVEENSLIMVEEPRTGAQEAGATAVALPEIQTKIIKGGFTRKRSGKAKLKVQVGMKSTPVDIVDATGDAVFQVRREGRGLAVAVEQGQVRLNDSTVLESDQVAQIDSQGGAIKVTTKPKLKAPKLKTPELRIRERDTGALPVKLKFPLWARVLDFASKAFVPRAQAAVFEITSGVKKRQVELKIEWEDVEGAVSYDIEIATDDQFTEVLKKDRVQASQYIYRAPVPKTKQKFYFRVAGVDSDGNIGELSEVQDAEIEPPPEPVAKPKPVRRPKPPEVPAVVEAPKTEDVPTFELDASVGAFYQTRKFSGEAIAPAEKRLKFVNASGLVPGVLALNAKMRLNASNEGYASHTLFFGAFATPSVGTPVKESVLKKEAAAVPYFQAWAGYSIPFWDWLQGGVGAYGATTSRFSVSNLALVSENVMLIGLMAQIEPLRPGTWPWRARLGAVGVGATGLDAAFSVRRKFFKGVFGELEMNARFISIEKAYGAALRVGYAL